MSDQQGADDTRGDAAVSPERVAELEARIEDLSRELQSPPRGPLGLPRPPTPAELLAFVDDHAIPAAIAALEANVRALEALRGAIRLLRRREDADLESRADGLRDRTDGVAREAVAELDRAVSDLSAAIQGSGLPEDSEARSVLREIRAVRDEVATALEPDDSRATESADPATGGNDVAEAGDGDDAETGRGDDDTDGAGTDIDVARELESIKDEVRGESDGGAADDREP